VVLRERTGLSVTRFSRSSRGHDATRPGRMRAPVRIRPKAEPTASRSRMIASLRVWVGRSSRVTRTHTRTLDSGRAARTGVTRARLVRAGLPRRVLAAVLFSLVPFPPPPPPIISTTSHLILLAAAAIGLRAPTATDSGSHHPVPFAASATRRRHRVKTARSAASPTRRFVSGHTLLRICAAALQRLSFMDSVGAST
jgi:hypothetical protein